MVRVFPFLAAVIALALGGTPALALWGASPGLSQGLPALGVAAVQGTTYRVGPDEDYAELQDIVDLLSPGDVVEVFARSSPYPGGIVFDQAGTDDAKITIRGIRIDGMRPVIEGDETTVEFRADHYVFEGFDVTGGSSRVLFHHAHDITIRDTVVHDCPGHGILGADFDSGSLLLDHVEVYNCGDGESRHPIYIATDPDAHPGSVFRMQHSYVHDGNGGNNVKSRAERNEIYYNWIEGGFYRELELIGPEEHDYDLAREDSDVVGNVFVKTQGSFVARIGGDSEEGDTGGRYRFVNNTFILQDDSPAAIQAFARVESLEMHNNAFYRIGGGGVEVLEDDDAEWTAGEPILAGQANWVPTASAVPDGWTGTLTGADPGFSDIGGDDPRPTASSPLVDAGTSSPSSPAGHDFPDPLALPLAHPPLRALEAPGTAEERPVTGAIDIGAFELGVDGGTNGCLTAIPGTPRTQGFPAQTGSFTVVADVTPLGGEIDAGVALASGAGTTWTDLAAIVLFGPDGMIAAREGGEYIESTVTYADGATHRVRLEVDVASHTYSAFVTAEEGPEQMIGTDLAFRNEQAGVTSLDHWAALSDEGSLETCNLEVD
jgi:hypothetical protein